MNKNQVKGRIKRVKGKASAIAGKVLHRPTLTAKGKLQQAAGTVQAVYGDLRSVAAKRAGASRKAVKKKGAVLEKQVRKKVRKAR
jgi:uncharacterized protein YjbJ (UPF0337 family)